MGLIIQDNTNVAEPDHEFGISQEEWLRTVRSFDTIEEIQDYVISYFLQVSNGTSENRKHKKSKLIKDIVLFLEEQFREELSLHVVAEKFYINPSYLSRLFKEEVGQIFTKYIMQLRVDKAQHLLQTTHMKVYEISEAVGYGDVKYFNKIFKDLTGMTPVDYRNS